MWRHKLTIWNILLVGGTFLLLMGLYTTWWGGDQASSLPHVAQGPKVPTAPILRDQQALSAFLVVAQKDLFSQDRKGPNQTQTKPNILEGHQLMGIIIIGDTRAALIGTKTPPRGKKQDAIDVVYLGDKWNGFKVEEITNESVVFHGQDGRKSLTFPE